MAIIDQRILIPARQEVVWTYLSDLSKNAEWQADCRGISFLSSKHDGVGTRWRSTTDRGNDVVLEITSWYNGLGYEYMFVDGMNLKETKGRLRLQEIPEGTVVQWTFSFEGGGLMGSGRTARQFDSTMAASLKALYKQIKTLNSEGLAARSLMRDAPDVEARAAYKPRHPSAADAPAESTEDAVLLPVTEPQLGAQDAGLVAAIDLSAEPPITVADTKPRPSVAVTADGDERFAPKPELVAAPVVEEPALNEEPAPVSAPAVSQPEPSPAPDMQPALVTETPPDRTAAAVAAAAAAASLPPADPHGKSIWEIFGVEKPTQAAATIPAATPKPIATEALVSEPESAPVVVQSTEVKSAEPAPVPDPKETLPLYVVPSPAVTVAALATVIAAVPDTVTAPEAVVSEPLVAVALPSPASTGSPRQGLRLVSRRGLVNLRRPG
ncbi:MAG: SRPBCC family protein [Anaerolineae bacterium]